MHRSEIFCFLAVWPQDAQALASGAVKSATVADLPTGGVAGVPRETAEMFRNGSSPRSKAACPLSKRLDFLGTASGLATSGDGDLREAARVLVEKERSRADAEAALTGFDAANGNLHGRGVALQERRKALARKIAEHQWRKDWLTLLPDLEKVLIRLAELQSRAWREELTIRGVMPSAIGIPFDLRPDNRETTPEDIRKVMRFQAALFGDDVPVMAQGGVYPSSLRIGWWRGF